MQQAPGKTLLQVTGILMLIDSIVALIILLIGMAAMIAVANYMPGLAFFVITALIFAIICYVLELVFGIFAAKYCNDLSRAGSLFKIGVFLIIISLLSLVLAIIGNSFTWSNAVALALSILYTIGANMNKQVAGSISYRR